MNLENQFFLQSHQLHITILKIMESFAFHKNAVNIFILNLIYWADLFLYPIFPGFVLCTVCADSEKSWYNRSLIGCVISSEEVIPNLFQRDGNPWVMSDLHTYTIQL